MAIFVENRNKRAVRESPFLFGSDHTKELGRFSGVEWKADNLRGEGQGRFSTPSGKVGGALKGGVGGRGESELDVQISCGDGRRQNGGAVFGDDPNGDVFGEARDGELEDGVGGCAGGFSDWGEGFGVVPDRGPIASGPVAEFDDAIGHWRNRLSRGVDREVGGGVDHVEKRFGAAFYSDRNWGGSPVVGVGGGLDVFEANPVEVEPIEAGIANFDEMFSGDEVHGV